MGSDLDDAFGRFHAALGRLERVAAERLGEAGEPENGPGDLETELQLMADDRARLALELEGTVARLTRFETASEHVERRVNAAIGLVEETVAELNGGLVEGTGPAAEADLLSGREG